MPNWLRSATDKKLCYFADMASSNNYMMKNKRINETITPPPSLVLNGVVPFYVSQSRDWITGSRSETIILFAFSIVDHYNVSFISY